MDESKYHQIVVWEATLLKEEEKPDFIKWFADNGFHEPLFLESITTLPDIKDGSPVPETGGRIDLLFKVHDEDISRFSVWRLQFGMRWWEDVLANNSSIYSYEVKQKYPKTW